MTARHAHWMIKFVAVCLLLPSFVQASPRSPTDSSCAPQAQSDVVARVGAVFSALTVMDDKAIDSVLAPDFYAFEGGRRFDRTSLVEVIRSAVQAGKKYTWSVTQPEVHATCHLAWITYRNQGQITDGENIQNVSWLESAVLRESHGQWLIAFLHSTRIREN
jgi:hypothetical protein